MLLIAGSGLLPTDACAYSVLAHESNIDALWDGHIRPLLLKRFPHTTADELLDARAYAYGGSVIQDLGYYPFGSHFFSNLLHYVRSGDFVEILIRDATNAQELAFAIGALAHYTSDTTGHPAAVNPSVALMFPKLRAKYGDSVTYVQSPAKHVMVEFSFDVVQAAAGRYAPAAYHDFVGFKVAKPLLERAFLETYGIEMKNVFAFDEDLALGTYRHAISDLIPRITRIAWRDKRDEIMKLMPGVDREHFVYVLTREDYEKQFGTDYRKPGIFVRILTFLYRLLPKIGPLKPLKFEAPTREAETLFLQSLTETRIRYQTVLTALASGRLSLRNEDFDTGKPSAHGEYELADETYAKLLKDLAKQKFAGMPEALGRNILAYYDAAPYRISGKKEARRLKDNIGRVARLRCALHVAGAICH